MAIKTFNLPDPGEGLVEAEIVEWKVAPGDTVKVNDMVLEIETAKSLVELPIPWAGTVKELLVEVGRHVDVGTPIISIDDGQGGDEEPAARRARRRGARQGRPAGGDPRRLRRQGRGHGTPSPQGKPMAVCRLGSVPDATPARASVQTETEQVAEHQPIAEKSAPAPRTESPAPAVAPVAREGRPKAKPPGSQARQGPRRRPLRRCRPVGRRRRHHPRRRQGARSTAARRLSRSPPRWA